MIRSLLGLVVFGAVLCAWIVTRPITPAEAPALAGTVDVTRAASPAILPITPIADIVALPQTPAPAPAPQTPVAAAVAPAIPEAPLPASRGHTDTEHLGTTTAQILAGLGLTIDAPDTTRTAPNAFEVLVLAALRAGHPDAEIDRLVNQAALLGDVTVPPVLVTAEGRVDTAVLLKALVVEAEIAAGAVRPATPEIPEGDGTGVEVRVVQRATETEHYRFYTVNRGDSLGAIALKFYGTAYDFPLIFDANRGILSSPDEIRIGQRLVIPAPADA